MAIGVITTHSGKDRRHIVNEIKVLCPLRLHDDNALRVLTFEFSPDFRDAFFKRLDLPWGSCLENIRRIKSQLDLFSHIAFGAVVIDGGKEQVMTTAGAVNVGHLWRDLDLTQLSAPTEHGKQAESR